MAANLGYHQPKPGSPSKFNGSLGYRATSKSYTAHLQDLLYRRNTKAVAATATMAVTGKVHNGTDDEEELTPASKTINENVKRGTGIYPQLQDNK